ncbi:MAG: hypothetical protein J6V78_00080 [Clostridia bacterium]|nr:hypothetical protein [Clostridia bacterium]
MLKQRFLKNSAKVLCVSTGILFISNLILLLNLLIPSFEEKIGFLSKLPDLSVYLFTFFSYLALNDEKAAHRKIKDIKSQKKVKYLKVLLIAIFVATFFKNTVAVILNDTIYNLFLVVTSFTFFMLVLSCWYFYRDRNEGKVKFISLVSIIVSFAYAIFKFVMYQNPVFVPGGMGAELTEYNNYHIAQYSFCLLQYAVNILMLVLVNKHYEKKELESEEKEKSLPKQERPQVVTIELQDSFGIDNIDDFEVSYESTEDNDE